MPPSSQTSRKSASSGKAVPQRPRLASRLNGAMACDTAFRLVARRHLAKLNDNHDATCRGDSEALHQMRVALTHLRTDILFFSPMVHDEKRDEIRDELKWLNSELGAVRDVDVAVERIEALDTTLPDADSALRAWNEKRKEGHENLTRALRSARYQWLIEQTTAWIENGPWSTRRGKLATTERASPFGTYSADKIAEWEKKLLKKSRKLADMGTKKRHHLRLMNKRLNYSIDSLEDLLAEKKFAKQKAAIKYLRRAQRSLGQLNDGARGKALAAELEEKGIQTPLQFLKPRRKKRLLKKAAKAYRRLGTLKPGR
jgi:CHAD domain-containing protein